MITAEEHLAPRRYFVKHRTAYDYPEPVQQCHERGFLSPRPTPTQTVLAHGVAISPEPTLRSEHVDRFGNSSHYFEVHTPHTSLEVVKEAVVDVAWPRVDLDRLDRWTLASARRALAENPTHRLDRAMFGLPSRQVRPPHRLREFTDTVLVADLPFGQVLVELTRGIHREFSYVPGATSVRTTVDELLDLRAGVCQDFAHLGIAVLRSLGIPARYVSGYIETAPPPGREKLQGSDASHAWLSVLAPDGNWIDLDPTNNQFADSRYIVTAWGRDFTDVSPLRGVIVTEATTSKLSVGVDVVRLPGSELPPYSVLAEELSAGL